jgi:hypothetical protein
VSTRNTPRPRRLVLALAITSLLPLSAQAATFTVTTLDDEFFDGTETVGAPDGAGLSLREAIGLANAAAGDDTIVFDGALTNGTSNLASIEMVVSSGITLTGGAQTLDAQNATRHIRVAAGGNLTIANLTLSNGNAGTNTDGTSDGGAILVDAGATLAATGMTFTGNDGFSGGAIDMNAGSTVSVGASTFTGNTALRAGGAIEHNGGAGSALTITNVTAIGNTTGPGPAPPGNGGFLHVTGAGNTNVTTGNYRNNTAATEGGAFWNDTGTLALTGPMTIDGNTASGPAADDGGGGVFQRPGGTTTIGAGVSITNNIANGAAGSGGGILNLGTVSVTGATITGNRSNRAGGGIESAAGTTTTLTNVTLTGNNTGVAPAVAAPGNGGGFHITGNGNATISGGTISNNVAALEGGGVWNGTGTMTIQNGTVINANTASGPAADDGGGGVFQTVGGGTTTILAGVQITNNIANGALGSGGGILNLSTVNVTGATITGNRSNRAGGGIESAAGTTTTLTNVTLNSNNTGVAPAVAAPGNGGGFHITGNGNATISGGTVNNNQAALEGGGLWNGSGQMTVTGTTINGNTAVGAGADDGGGGLFNNGGTLTVNNAVVSNNTAPGTSGSGGGYLNNVGGTLVISGGSITGNSASRAGGGIEDNAGASVTLTNVTVSGNSTGNNPGNGGGLHITGAGTVVLNTSTFSGNTAANEGGGLWNSGTGSMTLNQSTVSGNSSPAGGGIFKDLTGGTTRLNSSTIAFNTGTGLTSEGGSFTLANSVLSDNTAGACANSGGSSYTSAGFNLISTVTGCTITPLASDLTGRGAQLGALANNGGSTLTHLPGFTSPLIDAGSCSAGNDQRGTARPIDIAGIPNAANGCDIGAVEATAGGSPFVPPEVIPTLDWRGLLLALALVGLLGGLALRRVGSH